MSEKDETPSECLMGTTDSQGNSNLCCCYVIDQEGNYSDPCYTPADECC